MEPLSIWIVVGIVFLVVEILSVSFYSMFFGVGALVTALVTYLGFTTELTEQLLVFVVSSIASLYIFRSKFLNYFNRSKEDYKEIIDDMATVAQIIPADGEGKVFYRGAYWIAYTNASEDIETNTRVKIKKIDGIKLMVDPI